MSEYASRGPSREAAYSPRSSGSVEVVASPPRSLAQVAQDAVVNLEREVHGIERAIAAVKAAHTANDPARWEEARDSLDRHVTTAISARDRARAQSTALPSGATEAFSAAEYALAAHVQDVTGLNEAPTGFRPVQSEDAIVATLTSAPDGGAQRGFVQKEALLREQFDALEPGDRREIQRRVTQRRANDPLATAFTTRLTPERQQRLLSLLAGRPPRAAAVVTPANTHSAEAISPPDPESMVSNSASTSGSPQPPTT